MENNAVESSKMSCLAAAKLWTSPRKAVTRTNLSCAYGKTECRGWEARLCMMRLRSLSAQFRDQELRYVLAAKSEVRLLERTV